MPELIARFDIPNMHRKAWGKLIKEWAKGTTPKPADLEQLKAQLRQREMLNESTTPSPTGITIPAYVTDVKFVQNEKEILTIRLPPKDMLLQGEQEVSGTAQNPYPLPTFYDQFYVDNRKRSLRPTERLELHDARIGEYTSNICL